MNDIAPGVPETRPAVKPLRHRFRRRKQLEQDLQHITEEMYRRNKDLADTNKMLSLLRNIDRIVLESQVSLEAVCNHIAAAITQETSYPLLAILTLPKTRDKELQLYGWSLQNQDVAKTVSKHRLFSASIPTGKLLKLIAHNSAVDIGHLSEAEIATYMGGSEQAIAAAWHKVPIKSLYFVKLVARQKLVGVIVAGFYTEAAAVNQKDIELLERLCEPVGLALDNRLLFEENGQVLVQLRHSNKRLKQLNDTKDDFISMASHQLRTPLTAAKGYVSLVLDEDAGRINSKQRKLLEQSFASSQRMVYLIADLLNVSRIKTGKFYIERVSTNLSKLISDEMDQLRTTASAHNIELLFDPPVDFPSMMLDETKTRQVVMNFLDNAIYYTPNGGRVTVLLRDLPKSIEFEVQDNGIGVPKDEKHHLFTKFYRAKNAQRARPDGTGLGLYMAQKVIIAQGGSMIFDSVEGKGSQFGFSFPKQPVVETGQAGPSKPPSK